MTSSMALLLISRELSGTLTRNTINFVYSEAIYLNFPSAGDLELYLFHLNSVRSTSGTIL